MNEVHDVAHDPVLALAPYTASELARARNFKPSPAALYLASLATEKTRETGREVMRRICKLFGRMESNAFVTFPWEKLTILETTFIRRSLMGTIAPSTLRHTLSVLRSILFEAYKAEYITHEAWRRATTWPKLKAHTMPSGRTLLDGELRALRTHLAELPGAYGAMMTAIFAAGLGAGLRREELAVLRCDAMRGGKLLVFGKFQKEREVPVLHDMAKDIQAWIDARSKLDLRSETMFVRFACDGRLCDKAIPPKQMARRIVLAMRAAGIQNATTHDLRRTYATRLLRLTPMNNVQHMMGHENITTTARYDRGAAMAADEVAKKVSGWPIEVETAETEDRSAQ